MMSIQNCLYAYNDMEYLYTKNMGAKINNAGSNIGHNLCSRGAQAIH